MRRTTVITVIIALLAIPVCALSAEHMAMKTARMLSIEEQAKIAVRAAPPRVSDNAAIMVYGSGGKLIKFRDGTNGFTCLPDIEEQEDPDPVCYDAAAAQWINDLSSGAPKPTNAVPGIAYMAMGGWHWEMGGKILPTTKSEPEATRVKEPPHWMILWPFDSKSTGLPAKPLKAFGTYIMYDGTSYSHLMIYQNPLMIKGSWTPSVRY